jgi:hypothetical protein
VEINYFPHVAGTLLFWPKVNHNGWPSACGRGLQACTPPVRYRDGTSSVTFVAVRRLVRARRNWCEEAGVLE